MYIWLGIETNFNNLHDNSEVWIIQINNVIIVSISGHHGSKQFDNIFSIDDIVISSFVAHSKL